MHTKPVIAVFLWFAFAAHLSALPRDVSLTIHLRGVFKSKISLLGRSDSQVFKSITEVQNVSDKETARILVSKAYLPGEFVLRFDYQEKETSTPYPSEKYLFINDQDLELWVNPLYSNSKDSTWFQQNERENSAFTRFSEENGKRKVKLGLLQNFLMNYDDTKSEFYQEGIREYALRRNSYNQWLSDCVQKDKSLFVSNLYLFEYVPEISWTGTEADRIKSLITHYFDGMDFDSPLVIKLSELNKWMDSYVNLYGELSTTVALRDSLLPEAGRTAIERARKGNPMVYGWMVDYFYKGFESNGIPAGMKILEPYINDPNCLTSKRLEIARRLEGIKTLLPGTKTPDIIMKDLENNDFNLYSFETQGKYILVLFWAAGCSHCMETVDKLYPWQQEKERQQNITVIAIGLDESESEVKLWEHKKTELKAWKHLGEPLGVRSKVASDYYVLSTPVMILLDARSKNIIALPNTLEELAAAIK
jgi:thiol-disulfide isomerase/thioredoxin